MLANEAKKLSGADLPTSMLRWARNCNMMSGTFVILRGKPDKVTAAHCDEWLARLAVMTKEVTAFRKKLSPKTKPKKRKV
jgi:hypothetical protein